jgi:hypothetical protein
VRTTYLRTNLRMKKIKVETLAGFLEYDFLLKETG